MTTRMAQPRGITDEPVRGVTMALYGVALGKVPDDTLHDDDARGMPAIPAAPCTDRETT